MCLFLSDRSDNIATASSSSLYNDNGLYKWFCCTGDDRCMVIRHLVIFDTNLDPTVETMWPLDKGKERWLEDTNKLWFKERGAGRDKDKTILDRGVGSSSGGHGIKRLATGHATRHATRQK